MTFTELTVDGWEKDSVVLGSWTNGQDIVEDLVDGIRVAAGVTANTLQGDDIIYGKVSSVTSSVTGLVNNGTIITGNGKDSIKGEASRGDGVFNSFDTIDMGRGDDSLTGSVFAAGDGPDFGIFNLGLITMGQGNDSVTGFVSSVGGDESSNNNSIVNVSTIDSGRGNDSLTGSVSVAGNGSFNSGINNNVSNSTIDMGRGNDYEDDDYEDDDSTHTGSGNDSLTGTVSVAGNGNSNTGILNFGTINTGEDDDYEDDDYEDDDYEDDDSTHTGSGNDSLTGTVSVAGDGSSNDGILNFGTIDMGRGNDSITGAVFVEGDGSANSGINNDATIITGAGNDEVIAIGPDAFTGFDGSGDIYLDEGNDTIIGFGDQRVFGGSGIDTAEFGFDLDNSITLGSSSIDSIDITANDVTMSFTTVDLFSFNGETFLLSELQDMV